MLLYCKYPIVGSSSGDSTNARCLGMSVEVEQTMYRYDWADVTPSVAVVEALGRVTGREPTDLPRLNEPVDPDALDALCSNPTFDQGSVTVSFAYADRSVTVTGDGTVVVSCDSETFRPDQYGVNSDLVSIGR